MILNLSFDVFEKAMNGIEKLNASGIFYNNNIITIIEENKFVGHIFSGKYLDCGTMKGYVNSSLEVSKLKL